MLLRAVKALFGRSPAPTAPRDGFAAAFALFQEGRLDEAERECARATDAPRADLDYLLGLISERRKDLHRALDFFSAATRQRGTEPSFRFSKGETLLELREHAQALAELRAFLSLAPAGDPRAARACLSCSACCLASGDEPGASHWRERALKLAREDATALWQVADACYQDSDVAPARELLGSLAGDGASAARVRRAMMLPAIYGSREHIAEVRARFEGELDALLDQPIQPVEAPEVQVGVLPFYLAYHDETNATLMRKVCSVMRRAYPQASGSRAASNERSSGRRIRVGFVSSYFHSHSIGRITLGLIRDLPRARFEVHVFAIEPAQDPMRQAIESAADRYALLPNRLEAVRGAVSEARLDALLFADIGMHPTSYFLALHRLAPLQVALWGHPETTGIDTVDCFFTAAGIETPASDSHYTERLVRPDAFFLAGYARPARAEALSREQLGFARDATIYACLQPGFKLHPDMDAVFAGILQSDPRAEILMLESRPAWAGLLRARFARTLGEHASKIHMLPPMHHARFMATLAAADVALDPLHFGGGNSSCEAFAAGVPLVTLPGSHAYGRLTYGLYGEMGIEDCIVGTPSEYVQSATRFANDPDLRKQVSRMLEERSSLLFERKDITRALAEFLEGETRPG